MKLFLINGFLGSGKTTAIQQACTPLLKSNVKVAVITNDQGTDLVDTRFLKSFGIPAGEVSNGCFCCNFEQLAQTLTSLHQTERPEVIFAESVGSCTDLIATIAKPLANFYPEMEVVISVFVDASLLFSLIKGTSSFLNDQVRYIYKKQIAEADILIINKVDLLGRNELRLVSKVIRDDYSDKAVLYQNSLAPQNIKQWLQSLDQFSMHTARTSLELDYDIYAEGEAMLAWLDESLDIHTTDHTAYQVALKIIDEIEVDIRAHGYTIGHLKFLIDDGKTQQKISRTMIEQGEQVVLSHPLATNTVSMLINARVQTEASALKEAIHEVIETIAAQTNSRILVKKLSSFQPAYPKPTYRMAD